ncbi:MAG: hypothetical protein GX931_06050 [Acholeplasmataceae bacterium]|nr:hypothetical protein [Acholeplasmataceae bacterium]
MKKIWYKIVLSLILVVLLSVTLTSAYLTDSKTKDDTLTIGYLKIQEIQVYFEKDGSTLPATYATTIDGRDKVGVYEINITNPNDMKFIKNVRVDIYIISNVDAYLRVKLNEQIIRKKANYLGDLTETAITHEPTFFNYDETKWYKHESLNPYDTYYYYMTKTKQEDPLKISFVIPYDTTQDYSAYTDGHVLQLGIEANLVQANYGGPLHNWGLANPPWGGEW